MNVTLIAHTENPAVAVALTARNCYSALPIGVLVERVSDAPTGNDIIRRVLASGHDSILEAATFTFGIEDVSRVLTHQLVRHRHASFGQTSQRYTSLQDGEWYVVPESVANNKEALDYYNTAHDIAANCYAKLIELGIPKEDARFVIQQSARTKIVVTMNARALCHFFDVRCCNRAQWEIRKMAWKMRDIVMEKWPVLFENSGPGCMRGQCPEGDMCCGQPYAMVRHG